jgi:hypothetical protein
MEREALVAKALVTPRGLRPANAGGLAALRRAHAIAPAVRRV